MKDDQTTEPPIRRPRRAARLRVLVAAGVLIPLVAACGGGSSTDVASLGAAPATTAQPVKNPPTDPNDAALEFAQCIRDNGVTSFPDPQSGQTGTFAFRIGGDAGSGGASLDPSDATFQAAQEKCFPIMQAAIPQDSQQVDPDLEDKVNQMTKCMRDAGFDMGDIVIRRGTSSGTVSATATAPTDSAPSAPKFDPNDPKFQAAQRDCSAQAGLASPGGTSSAGGTGSAGLAISGGAK